MRDPWLEAQTLQQLGDCYARWFERTLPYRQTTVMTDYGVNTASGDEAAILARLSRTGNFVVRQGYMGLPRSAQHIKGHIYETRAYIYAYVSGGFIGRVREILGAEKELHVDIVAPGAPERLSYYPITRLNDKDSGCGGHVYSPDELRDQYKRFQPDLVRLLQDCHQVFVADSVWARNTYLWPILEQLV